MEAHRPTDGAPAGARSARFAYLRVGAADMKCLKQGCLISASAQTLRASIRSR